MTECQGCGAWNDRSRTRCVLCGTPLGEIDEWEATDELPPLPPLPDGGLATTMPSWLRDLPNRAPTTAAPLPSMDVPALGDPMPLPEPVPSLLPAMPPLGAQADPRTFLTDDDFPRWLHLLAAQHAAARQDVSPRAPGMEDSLAVAGAGTPEAEPVAMPLAAGVDWPRHGATAPIPAATLPPAEVAVIPPSDVGLPPDMAAALPPEPSQRVRSSWETLLLIALFIGLVVAAVWALVVNGVFSPATVP